MNREKKSGDHSGMMERAGFFCLSIQEEWGRAEGGCDTSALDMTVSLEWSFWCC